MNLDDLHLLIFVLPLTAFALLTRIGVGVWVWSGRDLYSVWRFLALMAYIIGGSFVVVMIGLLATGIYQQGAN